MISTGRDSISVLDPALQGQTLSEKAVDVHVVEGHEMIARWYHSPYESDLMVWFDAKGDLARFQLNSAGQITDWCQAEGLQTGLIVEIEFAEVRATTKAGPRRRAPVECAETIHFDSELNLRAVETARQLIANGSALPTAARVAILELLGRHWPKVTGARLSSSRSRFWGRFKRWTAGT